MTIDANALAADAVNYVGHAYVLGGAPGTDGRNPWDCSSAISWILGHDFGMRLPGQKNPGYDGSSHGPGSWQYITWSGAKTVGSPSAGVLVIWPGMGASGHIGMAISSTKMFSALNPELGSMVTPIVSTKSGLHIYRQIIGATGAETTSQLSGCIPGMMIAMAAIARMETLNAQVANRRYNRSRDRHGRMHGI